MDYNLKLYNSLEASELKHTAVVVLLCLLFLFVAMKLYKMIMTRRRMSYEEKEVLDNLKNDLEKMNELKDKKD